MGLVEIDADLRRYKPTQSDRWRFHGVPNAQGQDLSNYKLLKGEFKTPSDGAIITFKVIKSSYFFLLRSNI